jgi:hypothetical protein
VSTLPNTASACRPDTRSKTGVAEAVAHIPFPVGCIERSYSSGPGLFDAAIRNQAGNYVTPTAASIAADAAQKSDITPADSDDFTWRDCRRHLRESAAGCPPAAHRADVRLAVPHPWVDNALPNC